MAAGLIEKKFLGEKGIFLTFMSFLLVSTLLALTISISQASAGQEKNLAEEIAFKSVNNSFNSIRQQTIIAKEGYAGAAYSRVMPFYKFTAGSNWFEIEQNLPLGADFLKKTYDAFGLFSVFIGEKASNGMEVEISSNLANTGWGSEEDYPKIEYIAMPQCLKFSAAGDEDTKNGGVVNFAGGKITAGDQCDFQTNSIKSREFGIHLIGWTQTDITGLQCSGDLESEGACLDNANPESGGYTKIEVQLDGCDPCSINGFDGTGKAVISANIPEEPGQNTMVQLQTIGGTKNATISIGDNQSIEFSNELSPTGLEKLVFRAKIEFDVPFDEITLAPSQFDFGIKNTGFGVCRGTSEEACQP